MQNKMQWGNQTCNGAVPAHTSRIRPSGCRATCATRQCAVASALDRKERVITVFWLNQYAECPGIETGITVPGNCACWSHHIQTRRMTFSTTETRNVYRKRPCPRPALRICSTTAFEHACCSVHVASLVTLRGCYQLAACVHWPALAFLYFLPIPTT